MLANTADTGTLEYNTVDATLWFVHAVGRHLDLTADAALAAELAPALGEVLAAHLAGTRYGIGVDPSDGLLRCGRAGDPDVSPDVALTWMDARIDGVAVTPRHGKPVEVNALWINALAVLGQLLPAAESGPVDALRARATESFAERFRLDDGGLRDVVDVPGPSGAPVGDDVSVRPNQLLAASLPHGPFVGDAAAAGVVRATASLMTPLGPRSLAPTDPAYLGRHRGSPEQRDHAYHQGTVWPWLIGPYADAARAAGATLDDALLDGLVGHLGEAGLGSVSETADGDAPHQVTGCPFQAWSVAELLRVLKPSLRN
jgi:predicted glycogen debranching enzyme